MEQTIMANTTVGFRGIMNSTGMSQNSVMLKHDYLSKKMIDFVRKYNKELSKLHQETQYRAQAYSNSPL